MHGPAPFLRARKGEADGCSNNRPPLDATMGDATVADIGSIGAFPIFATV